MTPYEVLGVPRDATRSAVQSAYRRLSKTAHPDAGGDAAVFDALRRARDILVDPVRRRRYDETGADDDGPDNTDATILTHAVGALSAAISAAIQSGDVETFDVLGHARSAILGRIDDGNDTLAKIDASLPSLAKAARLLSRKDEGPDVLGIALRGQVEAARRHKDSVEAAETHLRAALVVLDAYAYDFKPGASPPAMTFNNIKLGRMNPGQRSTYKW